MLYGIKFCGGCNPRYDRPWAAGKLKSHFDGKIRFEYAVDGETYDLLVIIGGCSNCCASYEQYVTKGGVIKIWDEARVESAVSEIESIIKMEGK